MKAFCVDVSGSMSSHQLESAYQFVAKGLEPNDIIILFDIEAQVFTLEQFREWRDSTQPWTIFGCGGSCAKECLALAKKLGVHNTILISDGLLYAGQWQKFSRFINVDTILI